MSMAKPKQQQHDQLHAVNQGQLAAAAAGGAWGIRSSSFHYYITAVFVAASLAIVTVYWIAEIRQGRLWAANQNQNHQVMVKSSRTCEENDKPQQQQGAGGSSSSECNLFQGKWVFDNTSTYPLYREKQCSFMSDQLACHKYGRKDLSYQTWRWQPHHCPLPRFNATALLEKLRDKRMVFVGDSLIRGQWVSMLCLVDSSIPPHLKSIATNGSLISFKAIEYNASIQFYWAPLLVESNSDHPVNHRLAERIVRVQSIEKHARHWTDADVLVFNSYLWWLAPTMKVLWGSFEIPHNHDGIYKDVEVPRCYEMALHTWADWLELHVDRSKTQLFFVSLSPTHQRAEEWGGSAGQNCYQETEPILNKDGYWGSGSDTTLMRIVEETIEGLKSRGVHVQILNITQLSEYRKEGHPSIYRKQWEPLSEQQLSNPTTYADCAHWCLPGVPDVWNELLYAHLTFH